MRTLVFVRHDPDDNPPYAHPPAEGLIIIYDLNTGEVVEIEDNGFVPVPHATGNYLPPARRTHPHGHQTDRDPFSRRPLLHRRRSARQLGRLELPGRIHPRVRASCCIR